MTEPGWYPAEGDPPDTIRYWDGELWRGEPQPTMAAASAGPGPPMGTPYGAQHVPGQVESLSPFGYWIKGWTRSYSDFKGRSRRAEYGWFTLLNLGVVMVLMVPLIAGIAIDPNAETPHPLFWIGLALLLLYWLAALVPGIAILVRRWHDMGYSGWMALLHFVPLVNYIVPFFVLFMDSKREPNEWGTSPKYG